MPPSCRPCPRTPLWRGGPAPAVASNVAHPAFPERNGAPASSLNRTSGLCEPPLRPAEQPRHRVAQKLTESSKWRSKDVFLPGVPLIYITCGFIRVHFVGNTFDSNTATTPICRSSPRSRTTNLALAQTSPPTEPRARLSTHLRRCRLASLPNARRSTCFESKAVHTQDSLCSPAMRMGQEK